MIDSFISCLRQFGPIPSFDELIIQAAWQPRFVQEGGILFESGKICQELFFIQQGVLRIQVLQATGKEVTHFFLKEAQFCTILNSFTNQVPASESIQAACDAQVLVIRKHQLDELNQRLPYLKSLIDRIIQQGLLDKVQLRNAYLGLDSTTRYQLFLTRQAEVASRVSLADIASYLGITPQSLSRIRRNRSH